MEKFWIIVFTIIISIIFVGIISIALSGCTSTRPTDNAVLEHQRQIDALESRIRSYETATEFAVRELETLTGRAEKVGTTVDELIELFDEYQRTVERILRYYRATEGEIDNKIEGGACTGDCPRS